MPCFLWVFALAPYIEWIAGRPLLGAALSGVSAAVVGVIATLALWFALHVFFGSVEEVRAGPIALTLPDLASIQPVPFLIALGAGYLLLGRHWNLVAVLALSALAGAAISAGF